MDFFDLFPFSMLILGQKSCFLGPTIFKIPKLENSTTELTLMSRAFNWAYTTDQATTKSCQYPLINYLDPKDLQISDWLLTKVYFLLSHFALIQMVHLSLENKFGFVKNILLLKWILIDLLFSRCLMVSINQADPSCFYFRISWTLMEGRWFYFFVPSI